MKLSHTTLVAILATMTCANAQIMPEISSDLVVARSDAYELLDILAELKSLTNQKRELSEDHEDYQILSARADSALGNFLSALINSGLMGDVFKILTTDPGLQTQISALVKSAIQGLLVQGPALITAIWNAGLLQDIFSKFVNDADLRNSFLGVLSSIVETGLGLLTGGSTSTTTAAPAAAPAKTTAKRTVKEFTPEQIDKIKREIPFELLSEGEYLDKRDIVSTLVTVVKAIYDSGIVQSLISKALADPQATISFLTSALKYGAVLVEDIYNWAKSSGILNSILQWLSSNSSGIIHEVIVFLQSIFGTASASSTTTAKSAPVAAALAAPAVTPAVQAAVKTATVTQTHTTLVKRMMY